MVKGGKLRLGQIVGARELFRRLYKAHHAHENDKLARQLIDLDIAERWIKLVNFTDDFPEHFVVINSAARSNTGIEKYGTTLRKILPELDRELLTFWGITEC